MSREIYGFIYSSSRVLALFRLSHSLSSFISFSPKEEAEFCFDGYQSRSHNGSLRSRDLPYACVLRRESLVVYWNVWESGRLNYHWYFFFHWRWRTRSLYFGKLSSFFLFFLIQLNAKCEKYDSCKIKVQYWQVLFPMVNTIVKIGLGL